MSRSRHALTLGFTAALVACGDNANPNTTPDGGMPDSPPDAGIGLDRAQSGGSPSAIALNGSHAFIAVGPRVTVWDVTQSPPVQIGESPALRGVIGAVAVVGSRAYAAERVDLDSMIHVFDISNPAAIVETHAFSIKGTNEYSVIRDLEPGAGVLYAADQEQGVVELALTNPDAPTIEQVAGETGVATLHTQGTRLYYTAQGFINGATIGALDLANDLALVGSTALGNVAGVTALGNLAVGAGPDGIYVIDVTDFDNPVERYHTGDIEMGPFARAVAASGTQAFVPAEDGLYVVDLATPTAITHVGPVDLPTVSVNAAAASASTLAFVTDRGQLVVVPTATPTQATTARIADVTLCADCLSASVNESMLYVADIVGGLRTASLATLVAMGRSAALPVQTESGLQFVYEDVFAVGNVAYVADWLFGLRIYEIGETGTPTLVGSLDTPGSPSSVTVVGDRAYLTEGTDGGALRVIDVSNRTQPTELGFIATSKATAVAVRGNHAFVSDEPLFGPGGLRVFDVSNPAAITEVTLYDQDCTSARGVALEGDTAIVACGGDDFHLLDVTNPARPTRITVVHPESETSTAWSVAAYEGHAVLGHDNGVIVVKLGGTTPPVVASYPTAAAVRAIAVATPGRIVAAAGFGGIYQWQVD